MAHLAIGRMTRPGHGVDRLWNFGNAAYRL
jgi:hypothetical protein